MGFKSEYMLAEESLKMVLQEATRRYGEISLYYLARFLAVIACFRAKHPRTTVMRIDLRFPQRILTGDVDSPQYFARIDARVISRFIDSLKSRLRADHQRKGRRGEPSLPGYIWVREQDDAIYHHYHVVLLFNGNVYRHLGNFCDLGADNMATRSRQAWCSALGLPYPDFAQLVHFPDKGVYWLDRASAAPRSPEYHQFLLRLLYLAKTRTKDIGDGRRNFGCSQTSG